MHSYKSKTYFRVSILVFLLPCICSETAFVEEGPARFQLFSETSACHERSGTDSLVELSSSTVSLPACLRLASLFADDQTNRRCLSACWSKTTSRCHCHLDPVWMPLPNTSVDSAVVEWPCTSPQDCSYNGVCHYHSAGIGLSTCSCHAGWGGVRCGQLTLLPVDKMQMGFRDTTATTGENVSTWGSPILWDEVTQQWHGWASEMVHHCGINAWNANSQIVHIVSNHSAMGPFRRVGVFAPPFAHEPSVKRGPKGEWVMLYSAYNNITQLYSTLHRGYNDSATNEWKFAVCTNCSQGACLSPAGSPGCPFQRGHPQELNHPYIQMMAIAPTPYGPWKHQEIPSLTMPWDWNTALTIHPDGSAVALIRAGMVWHADPYSNPDTWHPVNGGNPDPKKQSPPWSVSVEDPFIWQDAHGVYHALAHCFSPFWGVHAYVDPETVPTNFSLGLLNWTVTGVAYSNQVHFTDGTSLYVSRRERPHLIFGRDGVTPVALSNGVAYGADPSAGGQDMTTTLVQPIRQPLDETLEGSGSASIFQ